MSFPFPRSNFTMVISVVVITIFTARLEDEISAEDYYYYHFDQDSTATPAIAIYLSFAHMQRHF